MNQAEQMFFSDWRSMLATVSYEERGPVYMRMLYDVAQHVRYKGLQKSDAVDELLETGTAHGLGQREELEMMIGDIFVRVENEPEITFDTNGGQHARQTKPPPQPPLPLPKILSKAQFLATLQIPNYLITGLLNRGYIYALTGQTGHAKTAVALLIAELVSCSDKNTMLGTHKVKKGRVIYFVGENPDDVIVRIMGMDKQRSDISPELDNVFFIPKRFDIEVMKVIIEADLKINGEAALIIVDTSIAYFLGDQENDNAQMAKHARTLRSLTALTGHPTVLVLCHPGKYANQQSDLLPRGGGAYLAEMDANLTLWMKSDDVAELYFTKMRGPRFQAISFRIEPVHDVLRDTDGESLGSIRAVVITQEQKEQQLTRTELDENRLLACMLKLPDSTLRQWAEELEWFFDNRRPDHSKVQRALEKLAGAKHSGKKLVISERSKWRLTEEGRKVALEFGARLQREAVAAAQPEMELVSPPAPRRFRVIDDCPPETVCLKCQKTGNVKRIKDPTKPGSESETLHTGCAELWFKSLK